MNMLTNAFNCPIFSGTSLVRFIATISGEDYCKLTLQASPSELTIILLLSEICEEFTGSTFEHIEQLNAS